MNFKNPIQASETAKLLVKITGLFHTTDQKEPSLYVTISNEKSDLKLINKQLKLTPAWKQMYLSDNPIIQQFVANREFLKFVIYLSETASDFNYRSDDISRNAHELLSQLDSIIQVKEKDDNNNQFIHLNKNPLVFTHAVTVFQQKHADIFTKNIQRYSKHKVDNFEKLFGNLNVIQITHSAANNLIHQNELYDIVAEWKLRMLDTIPDLIHYLNNLVRGSLLH